MAKILYINPTDSIRVKKIEERRYAEEAVLGAYDEERKSRDFLNKPSAPSVVYIKRTKRSARERKFKKRDA